MAALTLTETPGRSILIVLYVMCLYRVISTFQLKVYSSNLVLHFCKVWGLTGDRYKQQEAELF